MIWMTFEVVIPNNLLSKGIKLLCSDFNCENYIKPFVYCFNCQIFGCISTDCFNELYCEYCEKLFTRIVLCEL